LRENIVNCHRKEHNSSKSAWLGFGPWIQLS
jgi:hypothetical protein